MAKALQQEMDDMKAHHANKENEMAQKDADLEQLNMTLVEIKTELTFARAELDGAYGSRAERAADAAALSNQNEIVRLTGQVERLKQELAGTVQDLEAITKETIGSEREKIDLEHKVDEAIAAKAGLEADLEKSRHLITKLQEDLDSERFKVGVAQGGVTKVGAGAALLSEQFRTSMREERKRFHDDMKVRAQRAYENTCSLVMRYNLLINYTGGTRQVPKTGRGVEPTEKESSSAQRSSKSTVIIHQDQPWPYDAFSLFILSFLYTHLMPHSSKRLLPFRNFFGLVHLLIFLYMIPTR